VRRDLEVCRRGCDEVGGDLSVYRDEGRLEASLGRLADDVADGVERWHSRSLQKFGGADGQQESMAMRAIGGCGR